MEFSDIERHQKFIESFLRTNQIYIKDEKIRSTTLYISSQNIEKPEAL